ncbi:MAG: NAD-dependent epimerase/dehydratase family protein [Saprospiraceae bacterium]|nr:NAD-dependent epimerase/dehydratase family protein [Saprospiraceae bacterium]
MANRILIAGGSGLVGSELTAFLIKKGHLVRWLSRTPKVYQHIVECFSWNPEDLSIDENALQGVDIIINLTGSYSWRKVD